MQVQLFLITITHSIYSLDSIGCPDIPVYRGAEEAMVVTYNNDEHYHGVDGFNDVTFDTCPDTSRYVSNSEHTKKSQSICPGYIKKGPGGEVSWCENGNYGLWPSCQLISVTARLTPAAVVCSPG